MLRKPGPEAVELGHRGTEIALVGAHAFWDVSALPARFLDRYTGPGFEASFEELARLSSAAQPPSLEQIAEAAWLYDVILLPELAPPLIEYASNSSADSG